MSFGAPQLDSDWLKAELIQIHHQLVHAGLRLNI